MSKPTYEYYKTALGETALPCAFVDLDAFDANVQSVAQRAGKLPVRVATKSIRCAPLIRRVFELNKIYSGLMCYSPEEALFLWQNYGFKDILIGYPFVRPNSLDKIAQAVSQGADITLTFDLAEHVYAAAAAARKAGTTLSLCMDVDMSSDFGWLYFGVRRSSVKTPEAALALFHKIKAAPEVRLHSILGYEAQIAGVQDKDVGVKGAVVRILKRRSIQELAKRRRTVVNALRKAGAELAYVNGGGTGSIETTRTDGSVTELAAGSAFFCSGLFDKYQNFTHLPAAGFALEITRKPTNDIYVCAGGGYIASGSIGPEKLPSVWFPQNATLLENEGAGEVQTPVLLPNKKLSIGDPIFFRHAKAGEICERFNELFLISNGKIIDKVSTYRGEGKCFL